MAHESYGHALFSANWYRVATVKPRLRGHVHIHRHVYRGNVWYVIEDRVAGKYHRFNPASYRIVALMNGRRNMQEAWERITAELQDDTPSQDEIIALLGQLHSADLIQCDVTPDLAELFARRAKQRRQRWLGRFANPVSLRIPLIDPDPLLERLVAWCRPVLGWRGATLWLFMVLPALLLAPSHWSELSENFNEQLLGFDNLILLAVAFPLLKVLHELGHGVACRLRGGEVHELGIMLLVFFPAPYVDASSASAFNNKWQRMLVGAAGMLTETFIAAFAFYVWLLSEPGLPRSIAYNVIVMASVTTVVFNANPFLRYDGYYMLADWLEIPNLGSRSGRYWQYLADRYLFGVGKSDYPDASPGERRWFIAYEPLAFGYRIFLVFSIALFVAQKYFIIGVLMASWGLFMSIMMPAFKRLRALMNGSQYLQHAARIRTVLAGIALTLAILLFFVPIPHHTMVEGVIWPPEKAVLHAEASGFVDRLLAQSGDMLRSGQAVLESSDPALSAQRVVQSAKVEEVQAQYDAAWGTNPAKSAQLLEELRREKAALHRIDEELERLTLHAGVDGILLLHNPEDLPGRWLKKGEVVGYVHAADQPRVRVVVDQADVDLVRLATRGVLIKVPQDLSSYWPAGVMREVPAAGKELPSPVLGKQGGGDIELDPRDDKGTQSLQSHFEFELLMPADIPYHYIGNRAYVSFEHPSEPIAWRWWRSVRRLFLSHFQL